MNTRLTRVLKAVEESLHSNRPDSGRIAFGNGRFAIRVAGDLESRKKAARLVYQLYREKGYARHDPSGMWLSIFDAVPETTTLLVERISDGAAVGALTVVFDSSLGLPADAIYSSELDGLRARGRRLCEFMSLGVAGDNGDGSAVLVELFSGASILARELRDATDIVITVNPRHAGFYVRTLLLEKRGGERDYGKVGGAPAVLLRLDFDVQRESLRREHRPRPEGAPPSRVLYRFFHPMSEENEIRDVLRRDIRPLRAEEFIQLFLEETDVWAKAEPGQRAHLRDRYAGWRRAVEGRSRGFREALAPAKPVEDGAFPPVLGVGVSA